MSEETIQRAVWRSMYLRMKTGDFDPVEMVPYQTIGPDHLNTPINQVRSLHLQLYVFGAIYTTIL